jgi:hypothetical protein
MRSQYRIPQNNELPAQYFSLLSYIGALVVFIPVRLF